MDLKHKVLNLLDRAYEGEQTFVAKLSDEERVAVGALEQWSAKDLLAHIVAWKERLVREIAAAPSIEGPSAAIDIDQVNAEIFEEHRDRSWADILGWSEHVHESLVESTEAMDDDDLVDIQAAPRPDGRPLWRLVAGTSYTHSLLHLAQYYTDRGEAHYATELWEEAAVLLPQLDDSPTWLGTTRYNLACHYALSGQHERAISELREALQLNPDLTEWSKEDPDFASIREDPDYQALYSG